GYKEEISFPDAWERWFRRKNLWNKKSPCYIYARAFFNSSSKYRRGSGL
ncbi:hypothetical protein, partial [Sideroxydans sp. CL21]